MTTGGSGTWTLRTLDLNTSKKTYVSLGEFADLPDHQRFDAAMAAAAKLVGHVSKGGITAPKTIKDVCDNYVAHLRQTKTESAASDAARRFKSYVLNDQRFTSLEVSKLTPAHVDSWRRKLITSPVRQGVRGVRRRPDAYKLEVLNRPGFRGGQLV